MIGRRRSPGTRDARAVGRLPRLIIDWLVLTVLVSALALWLGNGPGDSVTGRFARLDAALYDLANRWRVVDWPSDTVLIEIDEPSLARIGRWPWPRAIHAALLETLTRAGARVIGLDLLLAEGAIDDQALIQALTAAPPTVLAVASEMDRQQREWPLYPVVEVDQVTHVGHVHFGFDRDGLVRGLYLVEGGLPAFSLALAARAIGRPAQAIAAHAYDAVIERRPARDGLWHREHFALLPRLAPGGVRLSYADVLAGQVPLDRLRGQTVIIGVTTAGMRDAYSNGVVEGMPVAPGALLHVAALGGLTEAGLASRIGIGIQNALTLTIMLATMIALYLSRPRGALLAVTMAMGATLGLAALLLALGLWLPPGGILLALLLAYPLWSWRRLEAVVGELGRQVSVLRDLPLALRASTRGDAMLARLMPADPHDARPWYAAPSDPITRAVSALQQSAAAAGVLRELLAIGLERLPHGALILAANGEVLLSNRQVRESFADLADNLDDGPAWLRRSFELPARWLDENSPRLTLECRDRGGRDWLLDAALVRPIDLPALWLIQFSDVTELRAMQRQREDMLRFLSHDLRSPQVSILAAIDESARADHGAAFEQIAIMARRSLDLADAFVQWTAAEHKPIEAQATDLAALTTEACDALWRDARLAGMRIDTDLPEQAPTTVDPGLVRRAIINLLENAIKYAAGSRVIDVSIDRHPSCWRLTVADRGPGLPAGDPDSLFTPYARGANQAHRSGSGLGLAFVRLVAQRHGGRVSAHARAGGGARFEFELPIDDAAGEADPQTTFESTSVPAGGQTHR
ncbi:MAG: CHASE2 domain-containing protein [Burkholderiaceae bacterium]